jgi:hypothetical protein
MQTPLTVEARAAGGDSWNVPSDVQRQLDWGSQVPEAVFFELFTALVEARHEWEKKPAYPFFKNEEYDEIVLEPVTFRKAVSDCQQEDQEDGADDNNSMDAEMARDGGNDNNGDDDEDDTMLWVVIPPFERMAINKPEEEEL